MLFPVHLSDVIEKADDPVRLIVSFPDFVSIELPSLNPLDTRTPPSTAPKSYDVTVGPPRDHASNPTGRAIRRDSVHELALPPPTRIFPFVCSARLETTWRRRDTTPPAPKLLSSRPFGINRTTE